MPTTTPEQWTEEQWVQHVVANAKDSYSLAVCTAALLLAEEPSDDENHQDEVLDNNINGLSGFQAGAAKAMARAIRSWVQAKQRGT